VSTLALIVLFTTLGGALSALAASVVLFLPAFLPKIAKRLGETVTTLKGMADKAIDDGEEDGSEE